MPFVNFKKVNVKNLKMEFKKTTKIWHIYSLRFKSLPGTQRYKRRWKENCATLLFYLLAFELKHRI